MRKLFYGVGYWDRPTTTTGKLNPVTGRRSIACDVKAFLSPKDRDAWVIKGLNRASVKSTEIRKLKLGLSLAEFNDFMFEVKYVK